MVPPVVTVPGSLADRWLLTPKQKKRGPEGAAFLEFGGARRDRTADLLHAMQALSQLSYSPVLVVPERVLTSEAAQFMDAFGGCQLSAAPSSSAPP